MAARHQAAVEVPDNIGPGDRSTTQADVVESGANCTTAARQSSTSGKISLRGMGAVFGNLIGIGIIVANFGVRSGVGSRRTSAVTPGYTFESGDDFEDTTELCCKIAAAYNVVPFGSVGTASSENVSFWNAHDCNSLVGGAALSSCLCGFLCPSIETCQNGTEMGAASIGGLRGFSRPVFLAAGATKPNLMETDAARALTDPENLIAGACSHDFDHAYHVFKDPRCKEENLSGCMADGMHQACRYCVGPLHENSSYPSCPSVAVNVPLFHLAQKTALGVFMEARLGWPAQYVTLLLDSGSTSLAVLSQDSVPDVSLVEKCPYGNVAYNVNRTVGILPQCSLADFHDAEMRWRCSLGSYEPCASTEKELWPLPESEQCRYPSQPGCLGYACYGDGSSFEATKLKDIMTVGAFAQKVPIQSIRRVAGMFQEAPSSGIIGVASQELNCANSSDADTCYPGAMQQLLLSQGLPRRLGICLGSAPVADDSAQIDYGTPGLLSLGGVDPRLTVGSPRYTEIPKQAGEYSGYYDVTMLGVGVNGRLGSRNSTLFEGAVVDTGAEALSLPEELWLTLLDQASNATCAHDSDCKLNVQLADVCLNLVGIFACNATNSRCNAPLNNVAISSIPILGYAALRYLYLELDLEHRGIGFAERSHEPCSAECSSFLAEITCSFAKGCSWQAGQCTGGTSTGGSTARGSTVSEESSCFEVDAGRS
eukprot:TRINITY_DN3288_c1_g1_i1.p1 TRINITY_DN3288_c1_g1~~TRINITY_DN3288_c1_g1_i1.p1  ORF type:complete len:710 (-),score=72.37 TRINITY_DN3288_c1_g1_i1:9-2138(-)